MKVIAYCALHYGTDYLEWAIRSVIDHIEEFHVIYTPIGSHGHRTDRACPDSRDDLYAAALRGAGDKLRWHEGTWPYEGAQRESIHEYAPDADVILVVDADEIWPVYYVHSAANLIAMNWEHGIDRPPQVREYRLPMVHFWRSFNRAILHDPAYPVRIIFPKAPPGEYTFRAYKVKDDSQLPGEPLYIAHLGYAQRSEIVEYKQHTHGHKMEWRRDVDWFNDKFLANAQHDTHPVGSEYWNPETVNPWDYLPEFMRSHPYADMDVIP
jgi:hypothetical protein